MCNGDMKIVKNNILTDSFRAAAVIWPHYLVSARDGRGRLRE